MRMLGARDPDAMCRIAEALGAWGEGDPIAEAPERAAAAFERVVGAFGLPMRVSALGIPRESLPMILERSLKNFNADPKREFVRERELLMQVLEATW
jgi:alcohol dehydrogenase class IV